MVVWVLLAGAALSSGCSATTRAKDVKFSGFLGDYSQLKLNPGEGSIYAYINPRTDFSKYDKIMFEPVTLLAAPDSKLGKAPKAELQALVDYLQATAREEVGRRFAVAEGAGPGVLRVRAALTDADTKNVIAATASTVSPIGLTLNGIQMLTLGTTLAAGEASLECEVLDSVTGERLAATVDRRLGTMAPDSRQFDKWDHVKAAMDYWVGRLVTNFAKLREGNRAGTATGD
jgi:hypothetical protein